MGPGGDQGCARPDDLIPAQAHRVQAPHLGACVRLVDDQQLGMLHDLHPARHLSSMEERMG